MEFEGLQYVVIDTDYKTPWIATKPLDTGKLPFIYVDMFNPHIIKPSIFV